MEIFEAYSGMYRCRYLPSYAQYLIENHLEEFAEEMTASGRKFKVPILLSLYSRFSSEQIKQLSRQSSLEYLRYIAENKAYDQVVNTMNRWMNDQLELVSKMAITACDITLINHIRGQALKKFLPLYSRDAQHIVEIAGEIDNILLGNSTSALDLYIDFLKKTISEQSNLANKVIEASPAITFLYDVVRQKQQFVSGNVQDIMGYAPDEITEMGDSFLIRLTHPNDLPLLVDHIREVITENSNETKQIEYRFRHKDGRYRWLRTYEVIFHRDASGNPLEILGKTFEITKEKQIAMALQKREKQLLEAQSIAHLGSFEWNIRDQRSTNTEEIYRIFEFNGEQHFDDFIHYVHDEDKQKVRDAIERSFINGHYECEYRYTKNNNEKVLWSLGNVEFRDSKPYRMVGTVQDITDFKRMEKELITKSHELAASNESLRHFAYVASHDMKEPLRKIIMFSDIVLAAEKNKLSEKSIQHLEKMQKAGMSLYRLIEDVLSFSLLETTEQPEVSGLDTLVEEVMEMLEETIHEKNATIVYKGLPGARVIRSQFRQLLQNLIANSLKFSRAGVDPEIHITGELTAHPSIKIPALTSQFLEVRVEDNGIGFPEEASDKIFELFSRYHSKSQYEGTGLGLSISKRIVENHRGVIKAYPKPVSGAVFVVVIPQ